MKAVVQRVNRAAVSVDGKFCGQIGKGLMVLFGVEAGDSAEMCRNLAAKIAKLRIFSDENGKTNLSVKDVNGGILAVSQFTLCADCSHGNRPSFINAAPPPLANALYEQFCGELAAYDIKTEKGIFGADMQIEMLCDGPFTITLEV